MSTRTLRARLDNPKLLRKPQVLARSTDQFNEVNFIFNLSSAFANDRLVEYLKELTGQVKSLISDIQTGVAFGDLIERSYRAGLEKNAQVFVGCLLELFAKRAELQAKVLYEPFQLMSALELLEKKYAKTPEARIAKRELRNLRQTVNDCLFEIGAALFEGYPNWFLEFAVLLAFEFNLNRKICGDDRDRVLSFFISLHYAFYIALDEKKNFTAIEYADKYFRAEEKCFEILYEKKHPEPLPCRQSGCEGAYRYPVSGRRTLMCDVEGCRDGYNPCVGTFFEGRKGDLSDWFLGLLTLYRTSWVAERAKDDEKLVKEMLGRKRYKEVMLGLAKENARTNNEIHEPGMVRMPTTGLVAHKSFEDDSIDLLSFPANSEFKAKFKRPVVLGYTIKK